MSRRGRLRGLEARLVIRSEDLEAVRLRTLTDCCVMVAGGLRPGEMDWDAAVRGYAAAWLSTQPFERQEAEAAFLESLKEEWWPGRAPMPHLGQVCGVGMLLRV